MQTKKPHEKVEIGVVVEGGEENNESIRTLIPVVSSLADGEGTSLPEKVVNGRTSPSPLLQENNSTARCIGSDLKSAPTPLCAETDSCTLLNLLQPENNKTYLKPSKNVFISTPDESVSDNFSIHMMSAKSDEDDDEDDSTTVSNTSPDSSYSCEPKEEDTTTVSNTSP